MRVGAAERLLPVLLLLSLLAGAPRVTAAGAPGLAVEGSDHAAVAADAPLAPYANAGYRLQVDDDGEQATVQVDLAPLHSAAPFTPVAPAAAAGVVERTARRVTAEADSVYEAVSVVLGWMVRHTVTQDDRGGDQSPAAVLARGSGTPRGLAGLAVALLAAVDVEARTVDGWVVGAPEVGAPHGAHTWIEVRLPDRGWVFSDPLYHHHYVPATYVVAAEGSGAGVPPRLEERRDRSRTVDLYPAGGPGVTARRNAEAQVAGTLRVVVADDGRETRGSTVLEGPDGRTSKVLVGGESVFVGLAGGAYRLEVYVEGRPPLVRRVEVAPRQRSAVFLRGADNAADGAAADDRATGADD